jgi:2-polyprenyl-3-methyl-5-hydroxy-6-metoxy-1,4-benzoquinol methylase
MSERLGFAFNKYNFNFDKCLSCETVFMNPRATPQILAEFYNNSELYRIWNKYVFPASEQVRRRKIFKPRVEKILRISNDYKIPTNCLIEIGAGFGIFCDEMNKKNIFKKVIAIEPSKYLADSCRSYGITTIEETIENISRIETKADVIVSFEVIEHIFSPELFLASAKKLLNKGGFLILTCPNYKGFDISTLGIVSESLDAEHINLFNTNSIQVLLKRCGFQVIECHTPGVIDVDIVRNKVISGDLDITNQPFLKTLLIDEWETLGNKFQYFLRKNNLSSHMMTIAKY